jgi:hypothetical protein
LDDELCIQQNSVHNGKATPPVQERAQHTQPLRGFPPYLVDVSRPGQPIIEGHPQITGYINPYDWLTEDSNWPRGSWIRPRVKIIAMFFDTLIAILHFLSQSSKSARYDSRELTSSDDLRDVAMTAVSSA